MKDKVYLQKYSSPQRWRTESLHNHRQLVLRQEEEISTVEFRSNSVSSRTPTPPERYSPHSPNEREVPISPRRN
ncbi:PDZ and LIM domain protein 2 isoform X1, partial [Tachysurus ichikawai]